VTRNRPGALARTNSSYSRSAAYSDRRVPCNCRSFSLLNLVAIFICYSSFRGPFIAPPPFYARFDDDQLLGSWSFALIFG